jgi:hypothetical protein
MKELFINELRRFRNTALIAAGVHLVLLLLINQLYNVLQVPHEMYMVMLCLYMIAGAGLGLYQFGSYRQPSRWIWLMHRPIAHHKVFAALAAAVAVVIMVSIGLPALTIVGANDIFSHRVVDMRHYLLVLHVMLFVAMAWVCGSYIMLARSRTAFVLIIVPLWMLLHGASGFVMLAPALLCLGLLGYVVYKAVKPNRTAPPATPGSLLAVSLPLHLGFYFAMFWAGSLGFQYGQMLVGVHPLNRDVDPVGGFTEASRAETPKLMELGLAASKDPRAEHLRRQVALSEGTSNSPFNPRRHLVRHALANVSDMSFATQGKRWTFSHDSMRYEAVDLRTGKPAGTLGMGGDQPFDHPPIIINVSPELIHLILPHALYALPTKGEPRTSLLAQFNKDEYLVSIPDDFDKRTYIVTNQRLLAYHAAPVADGPLKMMFSVPLPRQASDLATTDMVHLLDGTLVSLTYGAQMIKGVEGGMQVVYMVDDQGNAREVARRALTHDFPSLFEHKDFWLSPVLNIITDLPAAVFNAGKFPDGERFPSSQWKARPLVVWVAALFGMLASAIGAWWWLRRSTLTPRMRITWIASCLVFSLPALLSLIVLQARTRPLAASRPAPGAPSPAMTAT